MIVTDMNDQGHLWVRCTCDQTLRDGRQSTTGSRYFVLEAWEDIDCGPCTDHPDCHAGGLVLAGLESGDRELFCAADFEPVNSAESAELMASMIRSAA